jgi:hypothetical protein
MVRKEVKHMMVKGVDKEDLVTFTFSKSQVENELRWKHSKEFEYQGNMYDIVTFEKIGGNYVYMCWLDKKDTKLNRQLSKLFSLKWNSEKGKYHERSGLDHFVDSLICNYGNSLPIVDNDNHILFVRYKSNLLDLKMIPCSPPPKFI